MTQTNTFVSNDNGLNFDIEPNVTTSPNGIAIQSVNAKTSQSCQNPCNHSFVTISNVITLTPIIFL